MKIKTTLSAIIIFLMTISTFAQDSTNVDTTIRITFESLLDSNNMIFEAPEGFIEIDTIGNPQMNYEKAYKHPTKRFEVRYAIRNYTFPFYDKIFEMTALNISGGRLPNYTPFHPEAVKKEFGADAGATVLVEVGKEFGQDYKYCLFVYIHKEGVGDGYIFYMADDNTIIPDLMLPIFHCLKFKEDVEQNTSTDD